MAEDKRLDPSLEIKFDECVSCRWFLSDRCRLCGSGEFFEEEIDDEEPDEIDLIQMARGWYEDDE